jgi:peptide/nickel transport system substrate-binding protein
MKKLFFLFISIAFFYSSCSVSGSGKDKVAKGDKVYGGTLRLNEAEQYQTLYPAAITDVVSSNLACQIYDGLVKFNAKDLSIVPCLAEKWEIDAAGTTYTFHLKKGVMFHNNKCFPDGKGREMKAADVKYSFELLCVDSKDNCNFGATFKNKVVGANKFFEASKGTINGDLDGITVVDDYTVKITLTSPSESFLYVLALPATSIIAKEAVEKYGTDLKVGTGPFIFVENTGKDRLILKRNDNYHGVDSLGNQLPFLDSVVIIFIPTKKDELEKFQNGNLSAVEGLPAEFVKDIVEKEITDFQNKKPKYILDRTPEMASQYYSFNINKAPFNNIKVRKAFSYAIDRNKIIEDVLKGEAYGPGISGICPPSFKGYDITKLKGYNLDIIEAKKLLAEAGYPNGKGFPKVKIELNSSGSKNADVVVEIQKQLQDVLNINIDFDVVSLKQKLEDEKYARADIFRSTWVADFPSPENFLWIFYGANVPKDTAQPSWPNSTRYKNVDFDKLFEAGKSAKTTEESYTDFMKAEQVLMDDAPIIVLWYEVNNRLTKSSIHNYFSNPMRYNDYSQVYLKDITNTGDTKKGNDKK